MKRSWLITILFCLLLLGGGGAVLLLPQVVPFSQCSDVYKRYAKMDGVDATFIKDYKVNDTVFVDVTLLEAKTDSAWTVLQTDFNVPIIPEEYRELVAIYSSVDSWLAPKEDYTLPMDIVPHKNDAIVTSRKTQTISIFHLKKETPIDDIFIHKLNEI